MSRWQSPLTSRSAVVAPNLSPDPATPGTPLMFLGAHPSVARAHVAVRDDMTGAPQLVAYVVGAPDTEVSTADLREAVRRTLPTYMVPGAFVVLDALPLTANGKVDRRALLLRSDRK